MTDVARVGFSSDSKQISYSYAFALLAPALWAGNFVVARAVHQIVPPLTLNCLRWLIALLILLPLFGRTAWQARDEFIRKRRSIGLLALTGVIGFNSLLYVGLQHTTALSAAMIFSITPLLILGISVWLRDTSISILQMGLGTLSVFGALVILGGNVRDLGSSWFVSGNFVVLLSCLVWATYCVAIKRCPINADSGSILLVSVVCSLAIQIPLSLGELAITGLPHINYSALVGVAYLGIGAAALGFVIWQRAVNDLGAACCGVFLNFVPVFGVFMSVVILREPVLLHQIIGGVCVATAVTLAQVKNCAFAYQILEKIRAGDRATRPIRGRNKR
jgi:drug/metabolite transporter (DMT)-like permease